MISKITLKTSMITMTTWTNGMQMHQPTNGMKNTWKIITNGWKMNQSRITGRKNISRMSMNGITTSQMHWTGTYPIMLTKMPPIEKKTMLETLLSLKKNSLKVISELLLSQAVSHSIVNSNMSTVNMTTLSTTKSTSMRTMTETAWHKTNLPTPQDMRSTMVIPMTQTTQLPAMSKVHSSKLAENFLKTQIQLPEPVKRQHQLPEPVKRQHQLPEPVKIQHQLQEPVKRQHQLPEPGKRQPSLQVPNPQLKLTVTT